MDNKLVVGLGEVLFDCLPEGRKLGGAPANFAYHASQFGLDSCAVSAIGKDELGDEIVSIFDRHGLNYKLQRVDYPTGTVQVSLDAQGVPTYDIMQNVAWDNIAYTPELKELAGKTAAVCFGSLAQRSPVSRGTIREFLKDVPADALKIFDINLRQNFYDKETIKESLKLANVLKINDEELVAVSRLFGYPGIDLENKCWLILGKYNLKMLVLTCGTLGSYVFAPGLMSFQETPKVKVADTVGAGDSFTGSFCAAILKGMDIQAAHKLAVNVSAYVCTQSGAMPVLPEELKK